MAIIGNGEIPRVDAFDKVTGRTKYTEDLRPIYALTAKVYHSTIANGMVLKVDDAKARAIPGVVAVYSCFDVPQRPFPTAGHPWSEDKTRQDIADRLLLNRRIRYYGDDVAVIVAENAIAADRALAALEVEYEEYEPLLSPEAALAFEGEPLHREYPGNLLAHSEYSEGNLEEALTEEGLIHVGGVYQTPPAQHCHIENAASHAWMENGRLVVMSSTQIPHIMRRVIAQALGIPWGMVRIIKPAVGGGFGNKQDVLYEPLNAWLSQQLGGRCVALTLSREETFLNTRSRHAIKFHIDAWFRADGRLIARRLKAISNQGAYASHGHVVIGNSLSCFRNLYQDEKALFMEADSVYTNLPAAGAMRGYGIPQMVFACEAHMDDAAIRLNLDPIELRRKNMMRRGYVDPPSGITCLSDGLEACLKRGMDLCGWREKRALYARQSGTLRRGLGVGIFCYKSGLYPKLWEAASARLVLNQDGSAQLQVGATEIGQGSDTVFTQMAAETLGFSIKNIHIVSQQDTDITPFDPGAYGSRQSYVSGAAVKQTAEIFKEKLLTCAASMLNMNAASLNIRADSIIDADGNVLLSLSDLALHSFYDIENHRHITAESTKRSDSNTFSLGACFAEAEVDLSLCQVRILDIFNVHDCGTLLHPRLAEAQVHGGLAMAIGYGLSEEMRFDSSGRLLNGNLLDYKLPVALDMPQLKAHFTEIADASGPYGNKSLGEPPALAPAAAIRNAVLHATGIHFKEIPITPARLFQALYDNKD
jgi:xanthine dehydrogenase molybdenum-binding subunit